jgi:ABC-type lipoprotein release transport system permease subunit
LYPRAKGNSGEFADSQNGVFQQREFLEFVRVPAVGNSVAYTLGRSLAVVGDHGPESCRRSTFPPVALIVAVTILAIVAVTILAIVAVCACYLPVRRACRVNPLTVLRSD